MGFTRVISSLIRGVKLIFAAYNCCIGAHLPSKTRDRLQEVWVTQLGCEVLGQSCGLLDKDLEDHVS